MCPQAASSRYPHRLNKDGSCDSICAVCFATVGSARNEAELARLEDDHVCSLFNLYDLGKYQPEFESIDSRR